MQQQASLKSPNRQGVHANLPLPLMCDAGPGGIETHAWGLMSTVMTEVLCKADWLKLWDHVLSNSPPFFIFLLLSYLVYFRDQIMSAETREHMEGITRRCNPLDLNKVLPSPKHHYCFCTATATLVTTPVAFSCCIR